MKRWIANRLFYWLLDNVVSGRKPDFVIGGQADPYNRRWYLVPKNRLFNVYLHNFKRSDDDRALHDHPWSNVSLILRGSYIEHTPTGARAFNPGDIRVRLRGSDPHRIELFGVEAFNYMEECWTLFITGPKYREWGFHCRGGWVHWKLFTRTDDTGAIGKGCGE